MMTDPLADMLTRIRNALLRGKPTVITPASKLRETSYQFCKMKDIFVAS